MSATVLGSRTARLAIVLGCVAASCSPLATGADDGTSDFAAQPLEAGPPFLEVSGRALSALTGAPLGRVTLSLGRESETLWTEDGHFRARFEWPDAALPEVAARNHVAVALEASPPTVEGLDLGTLALEPYRTLAVHVRTSDGAPAAGATLELVPTRGRGWDRDERATLGRTGADGVARLALATGRVVVARLADEVSRPRCLYPGEERVSLDLERGAVVRVLQLASRTAEAGARVRLTRFEDFPWSVHELASGPTGRLERTLPSGRYELELLDPAFALASGVRFGERTGRRLTVLEIQEGVGATILVRRRPERTIALVDEATGEPLAPALVHVASFEGPPFTDPAGWVRLGRERRFEGDRIPLDALRLESYGGEVALYCRSPGYAEALVSRAELDLEGEIRMRVPLQRLERVPLRVVDDTGAPFRHPLIVRHEISSAVLFEGTPDVKGLLGPVPAGELPFELYLGTQSDSQRVGTVPHALFREEGVHTVVVTELGRILVHGGPADAPRLWCTDARGFTCEGRRVAGWTVFDQLLPGKYEVGSPAQIATLALRLARGLEALPIAVGGAEWVEVPYDPAWDTVEVLEGHVTATGIAPEKLFVLPYSAPVPLPVTVGLRTPRVRVGADGRYVLRDLEGRPTQLTLARALPDGTLTPLGVARPGGSARVDCARVSVDLAAWSSEELVRIGYAPRFAGSQILGRVTVESPGGVVVPLGALPVGTEELTVQGGETRVRVPLDLAPGASVLAIARR